MYQKIQEETQHSATVQLKAVEDRVAEFKQAQAEASSKCVDGQRHGLAAQANLYSTQLDNVAKHTELGKARHAGGGALQPMGAPAVRYQAPVWAVAERAETCTSQQCAHSDHQRVLAVQPGASPQQRFQTTTTGARATTGSEAQGSGKMRLPGVRPRQVRKDATGKIIMWYTDKPPTQWEELPSHVQAPYLASQGFDRDNWLERSKLSCGICGAHAPWRN